MTLSAYGLRCEYRSEPLGIDEPLPRFGWKLRSDEPGQRQLGYRVRVSDGEPTDWERTRLAWDSGWVEDDRQGEVRYGGTPLVSGVRYYWRLDLRDVSGRRCEPAVSWFEMARLEAHAWRARWIRADPDRVPPLSPPADSERSRRTRVLTPPTQFRTEFTLAGRPRRARLYVTAHGLYRARVNGLRVGHDELTPGWSDYHKHTTYQTYDISDHLRPAAANAIAITVADGWWSGYVGFDPRRPAFHYGTAPELLAEAVIDLDDGTRQVVATSGEWRLSDGAIRYADLLMGESHDARLATHGWDLPDFDDTAWTTAVVAPDGPGELLAEADEPIRVTRRLPASVVRQTRAAVIVDFGQNLAGRISLTVRGLPSGTRLSVRHGETLDAEGDLYTDNLRTAEATDHYVAAGGDLEVFEPVFTCHGFRYAEIRGLPEPLDPTDVVAEVMHNDTPWVGEFSCSDEDVNQLVSNIAWSQRGNFVGVPTDCPQRDERLGWTADAQIFLPTACRNADMAAFFTRWTRDLRASQSAAGAFPDFAPVVGAWPSGAPGWGDAGVVIPHHLWRTYGDQRILERSYPGMAAWIDYVARHNPGLVWREAVGMNYGDWLQVDADTPRDLVATAYFAHSTALVASAATALGRAAEAREYGELARRIRAAFAAEFVAADGTIGAGTQTGYLMALAWDLVPEDRVRRAFELLVADIEQRGTRLTTGFLGLPLLCPVLTRYGRADLAYALLHQDAYPSWGYSIRQGATTIWERWDGWTRERGFQSTAMNSFNHYSLGAVGDWLYGTVAGIGQTADSVGYRRVRIAPVVGGRLRWASARHDSVRGAIASRWALEGDQLTMEVEVPPGQDSEVRVPTANQDSVLLDGRPVADCPRVHGREPVADGLLLTVPAGRYRFSATAPAPLLPDRPVNPPC